MKSTSTRTSKAVYNFIFFLLIIFLSRNTFSQLPCGQNINFNTWSQEGDLTNGSWDVINGGFSVEQTINGTATWFVSPNDFFNVTIQGSITINQNPDDDLVGFVFGYQQPIGNLTTPNNTPMKTYIFDWKKGTQTFLGLNSQEGFALYEVDGPFDFTDITSDSWGAVYPDLWRRENNNSVTLINTNYNNNGWDYDQQYNFQLKYTADSIIIWIDDVLIFEESGCFEPGKFGFFNQSQDEVVYSDFSYQFEYGFTASETELCLDEPISFEIGSGCLNYLPPTINLEWNFGDNSTSAIEAPSHSYDSPGVYYVELVVSDNFNCFDTSTVQVEVLQPTSSGLTSMDTICGLEYNLSTSSSSGEWSGPDQASFSDFMSPNSTVQVPIPGDYTFTWKENNSNACPSSDTFKILFYPKPVADFIYSPNIITEEDNIIQFTDQSYDNITSWSWNIDHTFENDQNPLYTVENFNSSKIVNLEVENIYGCRSDITQQIPVYGNLSVYAPNAFTPDGDSFNEEWLVHANGIDFNQIDLRIYNRWGEIIWETNDLNQGWDGTYKGKNVPDGVYTWTLWTKLITDDTKLEYSGHITLLR